MYLLYKIEGHNRAFGGLSQFLMIANNREHETAFGILDQVLWRIGLVENDNSVPIRTIAKSVSEKFVGREAYDLKQCEYDFSLIPEMNKVEKQKRRRK